MATDVQVLLIITVGFLAFCAIIEFAPNRKKQKSRLMQTDGKRLIFEIPTPKQGKYSKYHQINQGSDKKC